MTPVVRLRQEHLDEMIAHARQDAPVECCGLLAGKDSTIVSVHRAQNVEKSPYRFSIDPREYLRLEHSLDERGLAILGTYHSHTGTEAVVSPTDIRMLGMWPGFTHFVIGLKDPAAPECRAWQVEDSQRLEQEYELLD